MRKAIILGLGILFFLLYTAFTRYVYVCEIKDNCGQTAAIPNDIRPFTLRVVDGDAIILKDYEELAFEKGSISPNLTLNNRAFLDKLAAYLKANPTKNLTITGLFRASERDLSSGMFENLGVARSNKLRNLLVQRGININRITLDHASIDGENLIVPATFELYENRPAEFSKDGDLVKTQFRFDDMTFSDANFEFDSDVFKPGSAFQIWADSVQIYFKLNTEKTLQIIGHTDNIGTIQYNKDLGYLRAQSAKAYFVQKGVAVPIKIGTRGEKSPIASNMFKKGRQKNRRVNFIIK